MLLGDIGWAANGNIMPCRFCEIDATVDGRVIEASAALANTPFVSQEGTRTVPYSSLADTKAAIAGEPIMLYKLGEICLLEVSAAVVRGARLHATGATDGRGVTALVTEEAYAIALKSAAAAGVKIPVLLIYDTV